MSLMNKDVFFSLAHNQSQNFITSLVSIVLQSKVHYVKSFKEGKRSSQDCELYRVCHFNSISYQSIEDKPLEQPFA